MKVFLGGTTNESTWRERIIPMLKMDFFTPVVSDWTPACMVEEIWQRKKCNFCLYVITPLMAGSYSIAEVVDDSNKRPDSTILIILRDDEDLTFTDGQWRSLDAVSKMVKSNGGHIFDNLVDAANYLNDQITGGERS